MSIFSLWRVLNPTSVRPEVGSTFSDSCSLSPLFGVSKLIWRPLSTSNVLRRAGWTDASVIADMRRHLSRRPSRPSAPLRGLCSKPQQTCLQLFSKGLTISSLLPYTNFVQASKVLTTSSLLFNDEFFTLPICWNSQKPYIEDKIRRSIYKRNYSYARPLLYILIRGLFKQVDIGNA